MKPIITILAIVFAFSATAQTPVNLNIYHKLGTADFAFNAPSQNNLMNDFKLTRMQYYITKFSVIHDGGQVTVIPSSVVALADAVATTTIPLGSLNVTNIEGVQFHIGVHTPENNNDPSLQPSGTPLSFQSPSMHWGWTSGYRFIALEGKTGPNLNQTTELHGLGNNNYFETTVMATANLFNGELYINVDADYNRALENINVSSGVVVHATNAEAAQMIYNFKSYVFSASSSLASIQENEDVKISIYPIPSNGTFTIATPTNFVGTSARVVNMNGQVVSSFLLQNGVNTTEVNVNEPGMYVVEFFNSDVKLYSHSVINK